MNLERFRETLDLMTDLNSELGLQSSLEQIRENLNNIVASPAQPNFQAGLANALAAFTSATAKLPESLTPQDVNLIEELGGLKYFDPLMAENIKGLIATNAMTPSVPRDSIQQFASDRATYIATITGLRNGLKNLGISGQQIAPGAADLSFAIPRELFENKLGPFAKELVFINRLMTHVSEAVTGEAEPIELENLSSTTPTIALTAGAKIISALAEMVSKFLEAWDKIEKFRAARQQLVELGLSPTALEEVTDQITTTVEETVEETVELTLSAFHGDPTRRNELRNALVQDTRRLFGQIERGLTVQFRANTDDAETEDQEALTAIKHAGQSLNFPSIQPEPMLLSNGDLIDGDVPEFKYVKKTTSRKTTTTKPSGKPTRST